MRLALLLTLAAGAIILGLMMAGSPSFCSGESKGSIVAALNCP